jgi:hypothetical protein
MLAWEGRNRTPSENALSASIGEAISWESGAAPCAPALASSRCACNTGALGVYWWQAAGRDQQDFCSCCITCPETGTSAGRAWVSDPLQAHDHALCPRPRPCGDSTVVGL